MKKGLSTVIATVILILLVVVATTIVWGFVNNTIREKTEEVGTCFDVETSRGVAINDFYTCYDSSNNEVQFSITIADVEVEGLLVSILAGGATKTFTLTNEDQVISDLKPYQGNLNQPVKLPGKNAGLTYVASGFSGLQKIDWIKIAPIIDGKQCDTSDSTYEIVDCSFLAS